MRVAALVLLAFTKGANAGFESNTTVITAYTCSQISSCIECFENKDCGIWLAGEGKCFDSCQDGADCYSLSDFQGQAPDTVCSLVATQQEYVEQCNKADDCTSCVETNLTDTTSTCQWFADTQSCGFGCKDGSDECGETTCQDDTASTSSNNDARCRGLACNFCLDLNCAWAPSVGCFASCDDIESNCFQGSEYTSQDYCKTEEEESQVCDGLACEFCLGVGSCAWLPEEEKCVDSCNAVVDARCFPSDSYEAADVCTAEPTEGGDDKEIDVESSTVEPESSTVEPSPPATSDQGNQEEQDDDCIKFSSCEECLQESCDWAPSAGCIGNCSVFDMSCYPGAVFDAFQVCETADGEEALPTSATATIGSSVSSVVAAVLIAVIASAMVVW